MPLTGEWDVIAFFLLPEGPDALAYENSITDVAWMAKPSEREGGMEKALALFDQFDATVAREKFEIVMRPSGS